MNATLTKPDPALTRDAAALYEALSDLIRVYQFRDRDRICCYDISVSQCYALQAVGAAGQLTVNELAAHLYVDKSTVSRIVDALERKGLVRKQPDASDRRVLQMTPTKKGRQLYERVRRDIESQEQRLLAEFDPDVRGAMIDLIGRLARAAEERVDTSGGTCCAI